MRKRKARLRILKKLSRAPGGNRARQGARLRHDRNLVRRRGSHRPEEQDHPSLGEARHPPQRAPRPAYCLHLHLRRSLPEGGQGRSPDPARLQHRGDELAPGGNRRGRRARHPRHPLGRPSRLAHVDTPRRSGQHHHHSAATEMPRAKPGRKRLAVHARKLALEPRVQIIRRSRRPLLRGLEQARRSALAHHVHRIAPMGPPVLISGTWYKISDRGALGGVTSSRASAIDPARALRRVSSPIVLMHPSMASPSIPTLSAHGAEMPAYGFGTSSLGDCGEIVASALRVGYRHIDTAWKYGTERGVGEGIRASGVRRDEIFLTTKVSHEYLRADDFARS